MPISYSSIVTRGCLCAVALAAAACSPRPVPSMTVTELMEDRVTLDGVLMKCNQNLAKARTDSNCVNARIAIERLDDQNAPAEEAKRRAEFERSREQLRALQDKQRQEQAAKTQVDAYHLPLVPVDPAAAPSPPPPATSLSDTNPPIVGRTNNP